VLGQPVHCGLGLATYLARRRAPDALTERIGIAMEQALDPENRVSLGPERDRFGLNAIQLDWRVGELDIKTMRKAITAFGMHMAEQGIGRLRIRDWLLADPPCCQAWARTWSVATTTCAPRG
jgi:hypothetical protein